MPNAGDGFRRGDCFSREVIDCTIGFEGEAPDDDDGPPGGGGFLEKLKREKPRACVRDGGRRKGR